MQDLGIRRAREHLQEAEEAYTSLKGANHIDDVDRYWFAFLAAIYRLYAKLEIGAKGCGRSTAWYGRRKHQRNQDPLLSYIHQARNTAEHGLDRITHHRSGALTIDHGSGAFKGRIVKNRQGTYLDIQEAPQDLEINFRPAKLILIPVVNAKHGATYHVPKNHLGTTINEATPESLSGLVLAYSREMIEDAERLPRH